MMANVFRRVREVALLAGGVMIVGGVACHDVPAAFVVLGLALTFGAISGMILCRRKS